jgi:5-methylcytosine-specific restriction protein A
MSTTSRRQFIESQGATCTNWTWSWSFINEAEKVVIFGAWDTHDEGGRSLILSEDWQRSRKGRKLPGYAQARKHIGLIEEEGYVLKTFPMKETSADQNDEAAPSKISDFTPNLIVKSLLRIGKAWYAWGGVATSRLPEELEGNETLIEGAVRVISVNSYERNPVARARCIEHHGYKCAICTFDFAEFYGEIGQHFIHVHHIVPLGQMRGEYKVDPVKDLIPVCANCHAMIHSTRPALEVDQLRQYLSQHRTGSQR